MTHAKQILSFCLALLLSVLLCSCGNKGEIEYDEETFQDYANTQYTAEFGTSSAYEDNILIVFLTTDNYNEYCYIAWVGDHIDRAISDRFGNEQTALGAAMAASVNQTMYKYSLTQNLSSVIDTMTNVVTGLGLADSFGDACRDVNHKQVKSHLSNHTGLQISEQTLNVSLENFTEKTGIPVVVTVERAENVFTSGGNGNSGVLLPVAITVGVCALILIVYLVSRRKKTY